MDGSEEVGLNEDAELRKLRWRCRRGMKELDQLLERWLDTQWAASSERDRGVFLQLLACEDDRLWHWFLGHEVAPDAALDSLVQRIRAMPPPDDGSRDPRAG